MSKSHRSLALWSERLRQERHRSVRASGATPARFARILFWPPAVSASRAPRHHRCTTARLGFAERSLSGRFGAGALRPVLGVTAFSRNAERVGFRAQRYAPLRVRALSSSAIAAHRFGKPLHNAGQSNNPAFGAAPGSAGRRSCCFISQVWRRERKAEPTTMRSVLLSMRQGPVLVPK